MCNCCNAMSPKWFFCNTIYAGKIWNQSCLSSISSILAVFRISSNVTFPRMKISSSTTHSWFVCVLLIHLSCHLHLFSISRWKTVTMLLLCPCWTTQTPLNLIMYHADLLLLLSFPKQVNSEWLGVPTPKGEKIFKKKNYNQHGISNHPVCLKMINAQ